VTRHKALIGLLVAAVLYACGGNGNEGDTSQTENRTTEPSSTTTTITSKTTGSAKVGEELTLKTASFSDPPNQPIAVTVTQIVDPAESEGGLQQPGERGVAVQLRYVNHGSGVYSDSVVNEVKLIDQMDQSFAASVGGTKAGPNFPSGSVRLNPGEAALGFVGFDVPTGSTVVRVRVTLESGTGGTGDWTIS
jgi:hypothetical protein